MKNMKNLNLIFYYFDYYYYFITFMFLPLKMSSILLRVKNDVDIFEECLTTYGLFYLKYIYNSTTGFILAEVQGDIYCRILQC